MKPSVVVMLGALELTACLTTPAAETGFSKRVRELSPGACSSDSFIEDAEDADNQILKREGDQRGQDNVTFSEGGPLASSGSQPHP